MKIGILSMQRVINYGSYLQAYALKSMLQEIGCQVYFIDIVKGKIIVEKKEGVSKRRRIDKYLFKRIEHVHFAKKRRKKFEENYLPMLGASSPVRESECDAIIIGSDEVFNCLQPSQWGFSTQLFGDTTVPSASYAASCGYTTFDAAEKKGITSDISRSLNKMVAISVRDSNTAEFVYRLTRKEPVQHLDPVLVHSWDDHQIKRPSISDYILIYAYDNRINACNEIEAIKQFAREHNKKIISCGVYQRWCDKNISCSPLELLSYFDGADFVITDTFHGTVISIKRNKKFATIIRESNRNKISDLLSRFGLEDREVKNVSELSSVITAEINYRQVNSVIEREREKAIAYLRSLINKIQEF